MAHAFDIGMFMRGRADVLGSLFARVLEDYVAVLHDVLAFIPLRTAALQNALISVRAAAVRADASRGAPADVAAVQLAQHAFYAAWTAGSPFASVGVLTHDDFAVTLRTYATHEILTPPRLWCNVHCIPQLHASDAATYALEEERKRQSLRSMDWEVLVKTLHYLKLPSVALQSLYGSGKLTLHSMYQARAASSATYAPVAAPTPAAGGWLSCAAVHMDVNCPAFKSLPSLLQPISKPLCELLVEDVRNRCIGHDRRLPLTFDALQTAVRAFIDAANAVDICAKHIEDALTVAVRHPSADPTLRDYHLAVQQLRQLILSFIAHATIHSTPRSLPDPGTWARLMENTEAYSGQRRMHVLLIPPDLQADDSTLQQLARVQWTLVFDAYAGAAYASPAARALYDGRTRLGAKQAVQLHSVAGTALQKDVSSSKIGTHTWIVGTGATSSEDAVATRTRRNALRGVLRAAMQLAEADGMSTHVTVLAYGPYGSGGDRPSRAYRVPAAGPAGGEVPDSEYPATAHQLLTAAAESPTSRVAFVCDNADTVAALSADVMIHNHNELLGQTEEFVFPLDMLAAAFACTLTTNDADDIVSIAINTQHGYAWSPPLRAPLTTYAQLRERWRSLGLNVLERAHLQPLADRTATLQAQHAYLTGAPAAWQLLMTTDGIVHRSALESQLQKRVEKAFRDLDHAIGGRNSGEVILAHHACMGATTIARAVAARFALERPVAELQVVAQVHVAHAAVDAAAQIAQIATETRSSVLLLVDGDSAAYAQAVTDALPATVRFVRLRVQRVSELFMVAPAVVSSATVHVGAATDADAEALRAWRERCWITLQDARSGSTHPDDVRWNNTWEMIAPGLASGFTTDKEHELAADEHESLPLFFGVNVIAAQGRAAEMQALWCQLNTRVARALFPLRVKETDASDCAARRLAHVLRVVAFVQVFARMTVPAPMLCDVLTAAGGDAPAAGTLEGSVQRALRWHEGDRAGAYARFGTATTTPLMSALPPACAAFNISADTLLALRAPSKSVQFSHALLAMCVLQWLLRVHQPGETQDVVSHTALYNPQILSIPDAMQAYAYMALDFVLTWACRTAGRTSIQDGDHCVRAASQLLYQRRVPTINGAVTAFTPLITCLEDAAVAQADDAVARMRPVTAAALPEASDAEKWLYTPAVLLLRIAAQRFSGPPPSPNVHLLRLLTQRLTPEPISARNVVLTLTFVPLSRPALGILERETAGWSTCAALCDALLSEHGWHTHALDAVGNAWRRYAEWLLFRAPLLCSMPVSLARLPGSATSMERTVSEHSTSPAVTRGMLRSRFQVCYERSVELMQEELKLTTADQRLANYAPANLVRSAVTYLRCDAALGEEGADVNYVANVVTTALQALVAGFDLLDQSSSFSDGDSKQRRALASSRRHLLVSFCGVSVTALSGGAAAFWRHVDRSDASLPELNTALQLQVLTATGSDHTQSREGLENPSFIRMVAAESRDVQARAKRLALAMLQSPTASREDYCSAAITAVRVFPWLSHAQLRDAGKFPTLRAMQRELAANMAVAVSNNQHYALLVACAFSCYVCVWLASCERRECRLTLADAALALQAILHPSDGIHDASGAFVAAAHVVAPSSEGTWRFQYVLRAALADDARDADAAAPTFAAVRHSAVNEPYKDVLLVAMLVASVDDDGHVLLSMGVVTLPAVIDKKTSSGVVARRDVRVGAAVVAWLGVSVCGRVRAFIRRVAAASERVGVIPSSDAEVRDMRPLHFTASTGNARRDEDGTDDGDDTPVRRGWALAPNEAVAVTCVPAAAAVPAAAPAAVLDEASKRLRNARKKLCQALEAAAAALVPRDGMIRAVHDAMRWEVVTAAHSAAVGASERVEKVIQRVRELEEVVGTDRSREEFVHCVTVATAVRT